ncbi:MAG: hypothetical protein M3Q36_03005 [bacterium]|nr:hypothetical protein [bacterium]
MTKSHKSTDELVGQLFEKVASIKLNDSAAIFGTTSRESMLQSLRKSIAELGSAISAKKTYDDIMKKYEDAVSNIDTAGVTGLISESELTDYYALVDDIWAAIERQKK